MKRSLSIALVMFAVACSRSTPPPAVRTAAPVATAGAADHESERGAAVMAAIRDISVFPSTDEGARGFVTELASAARAHDVARWSRLERELVADNVRFELALTFEGNRQLAARVLPGFGARAAQVRDTLAAMREPLQVSVASATGEELADGAPHGFDPGIATVRQHLRPTVRFVRVEVLDAAGQRLRLEPMAWLGARWTWLGDIWAAPPGLPANPAVAPAAVAAQR